MAKGPTSCGRPARGTGAQKSSRLMPVKAHAAGCGQPGRRRSDRRASAVAHRRRPMWPGCEPVQSGCERAPPSDPAPPSRPAGRADQARSGPDPEAVPDVTRRPQVWGRFDTSGSRGRCSMGVLRGDYSRPGPDPEAPGLGPVRSPPPLPPPVGAGPWGAENIAAPQPPGCRVPLLRDRAPRGALASRRRGPEAQRAGSALRRVRPCPRSSGLEQVPQRPLRPRPRTPRAERGALRPRRRGRAARAAPVRGGRAGFRPRAGSACAAKGRRGRGHLREGPLLLGGGVGSRERQTGEGDGRRDGKWTRGGEGGG